MYDYHDLRLLGDEAYALIREMWNLKAIDIGVTKSWTETAPTVGDHSVILYKNPDYGITYEINVSMDEYQIVGYAYINRTGPIYGYKRKMYSMHDSNLMAMLTRMLTLLKEKRQLSDETYELHSPMHILRRMEAQIYATAEYTPGIEYCEPDRQGDQSIPAE